MRVSADGLPIHLVRYGAPPTRSVPVIYVHGATFPSALAVGWRFADERSWSDDLLAGGYDAWGFDFAGYGPDRYREMESPPLPGPLGRSNQAVRQLAAVVERIRSITGEGRVALLAHSWGTMVAGRYAAENPSNIERLVLFGPILRRHGNLSPDVAKLPGWSLVSPQQQLERFRGDVPSNEAELITDAMFEPWGKAYLDSDPRAAGRSPPAVAVPTGPEADIAYARAGIIPYDPARIRCPVAIVRGKWDSRVTDEDVALFRKELVNCPSITDAALEHGTHLMHLETGRARLWSATRNTLAPAKQTAIDKHAVMFEVLPSKGGMHDYLTTAAALRPLLDEVDGFISIERFRSLERPGWILSLSFWADDAAIAAWRSRDRHHSAQVKGRGGIFHDYRLRVAHILFDDGVPGSRQPRHESSYNDPARRRIDHVALLQATGTIPEALFQLLANSSSIRSSKRFESLSVEGKTVHLVEFASAAAASVWRSRVEDLADACCAGIRLRVQLMEVLRDYGMSDRIEAPQYHRPVPTSAGGTNTA